MCHYHEDASPCDVPSAVDLVSHAENGGCVKTDIYTFNFSHEITNRMVLIQHYFTILSLAQYWLCQGITDYETWHKTVTSCGFKVTRSLRQSSGSLPRRR